MGTIRRRGSTGMTGGLVVVGHASRDIAPDDPRGWRLGGAVSYVSLAAARLRVPVRAVIGLDELSANADELDLLREAGVELSPVLFPEAPVFRNVVTPMGRRQECLAVGRRLRPSDVPWEWRGAAAWAFVPVLDEIGGEGWTGLPGPDALVAVGWQGMLREPRAGGPTRARAPRPDPLLERADVTVVSEEDLAASGTSWSDPDGSALLGKLLRRPGQLLVLTQGPAGGWLLERRDRGWNAVRYLAVRPGVAVDETGAGDVFLGAFLATSLDPALVGADARGGSRSIQRRRHRIAAVAAAMAIEGPGLSAIPTRRELLARLAMLE